MDTHELSGYENEPVESFTPVPDEYYPELYQLQSRDRIEEYRYYRDTLAAFSARRVLELGCGTGQIAETLYQNGCDIVGIDTSRAMLGFNRHTRQAPVLEMDMCALGFKRVFDAVIIPCNSLNLLVDETIIISCLEGIRTILKPQALLIAELFVPNEALLENAETRLFQFQSYDLKEPGKMVKETIRFYNHQTQILGLEERYKTRPYAKTGIRQNYSQTFELAAFSRDRWIDVLAAGGFSVHSEHGSFSLQRFQSGQDSSLIVQAQSS